MTKNQNNLSQSRSNCKCAKTIPHNISKHMMLFNKNLAIANRSRVSCINTNNNTMTLKSGLEVTQGH